MVKLHLNFCDIEGGDVIYWGDVQVYHEAMFFRLMVTSQQLTLSTSVKKCCWCLPSLKTRTGISYE